MAATDKKELKRRRLIKETISSMNKQIGKLEEQKNFYIEKGREAKEKGLDNQYNLALSGLKMTLIQQRRIEEMVLNFEITSQMRDMSQMTVDFLGGMGALSRDMSKLTSEKTFLKVEKEFSGAMAGLERQMAGMDKFMDETQSAFSRNTGMSNDESKIVDGLFDSETSPSQLTDAQIDKEMEELKKLMEG